MVDADRVRAELQRLRWQEREALMDAVRDGRAVADPRLASLAAEYADATREELLRVYSRVLLPVGVAALFTLLVVLALNGDDIDFGAVAAGVVVACTAMVLIVWALTLRPLARARDENRYVAGLATDRPPRRDASHWIIAWLAAWPIAGVVAALVRATALPFAGPAAFVAWFAVLWTVKRVLDSRYGHAA